jgi:protein-S-isoprenylcysteine O-methyltransferase Ste14
MTTSIRKLASRSWLRLVQRCLERSRLVISQIWVAGIFALASLSRSHWSENEVYETTITSVALILTMLGCVGRIWSIAHIAGRKNAELVTVGPYSLCRNPLYFCSFLAALGIALSTCTLTIPAVVVIGFAAVYPVVIRAEENRLSALFGESFAEYCQTTPSFFPRFRSYVPASLLLIDMRSFNRGVRDSGWLILGFITARMNAELHEAGWGIVLWILH